MAIITNLGSTRPDSWEKTQKPVSVFNTSSEDAPPFACLQFKKPDGFTRSDLGTSTHELNAEEDTFFAQELIGNKLVWLVAKPDYQGVLYQDPSRFVFAGEQGIKAKSFGTAYLGFPGRVLHDGGLDRLPNWQQCGPVENEWFVKSTGSAFICMCHDVSAPSGQYAVHTVWVAPNYSPRMINVSTRFSSSQMSVASLDYLTFPNLTQPAEAGGNFALPLDTSYTAQNFFEILLDGTDGSGNQVGQTIKVPVNGDYKITFNTTIWSTTATRGSELKIQAYHYSAEDGGSTATDWLGAIGQEKEKDTSGGVDVIAEVIGKGNIAFTGIIRNMKKDDGIRFRNAGGDTVQLLYAAVTVELVAQRPPTDESEATGLNYPP